MQNEKHFGLRIEADLLKKFRYVCEYDGRSANGKILVMIRQCVSEFEDEYGNIQIVDENANP